MPLSNEEKILEKLEQILKVLVIQIGNDKSAGERVHLLRIAGLDYKTIAEILETKIETVRVLASQYKAKRGK
jgi:DNA-directed RNA polymerase specialized sigma24 family protein